MEEQRFSDSPDEIEDGKNSVEGIFSKITDTVALDSAILLLEISPKGICMQHA